MKVKDCMCKEVCCVAPTATVSEAVKVMLDKHVGCVPVCDSTSNVVGLITDRDVLLRTIACEKEVKNTPVSEVMTCKVCCCTPDCDVDEATTLMSDYQIRRLPVVENDKIVGILTLGDLAKNENVSNTEVSDTLQNICNCDDKNAQ